MIEKNDLQRKLARTVLGFQDSYLARDNSPVGLLCQVWMPEETSTGALELKTKGMPFCVAGMGDLLALFRCISCRFNFGADPSNPETLGAPGRVYTSGKPELACNVQQYSRESYLRRAEAEQCRVQSSMLLPVFSIPPGTSNPASTALGVVEIVQTSDDMAFLPVAGLLGTVLMKCGLYTSSMEEVETRLPTAATNLQLPLRTGLLEDEDGNDGGNGSSDMGDAGSVEIEDEARDHQKQRAKKKGGEGSGASAGAFGGRRGVSGDTNTRGTDDDELENDESDDDGDDGDDYEPGKGASRREHRQNRSGLRRNTTHSSAGNNNSKYGRPGGGTTKAGKSGVKLTLADLQGQFGVGLKEAANTLGVCTTTLKRACRRHGIQRWPRRALQKVSRTLDEMERRGAIQNNMVEAVPMGSLIHPTTGQLLIPTLPIPPTSATPFEEMPIDFRWAALANMIPRMNGGGLGLIPGLALPMPSPSDFSLEGAVTVTQGGNNNNKTMKNQNGKEMAVGNGNGNAVTAGTGMTSGWDQIGTAAGAAAAQRQLQRQHQQQQQQPHLAGIVPAAPPVHVVPAYLRNGVVNPPPPNSAGPRSSFESPFDNHPNAPVLQLPSPGISLPTFSQMSLPSFGPSFLNPSALMGGDGHTTGHYAGTGGGTLGTRAIGSGPVDDVGLLDSTILELMLAEDSRTLVGATDEDLKRLFPTHPAAQQPLH